MFNLTSMKDMRVFSIRNSTWGDVFNIHCCPLTPVLNHKAYNNPPHPTSHQDSVLLSDARENTLKGASLVVLATGSVLPEERISCSFPPGDQLQWDKVEVKMYLTPAKFSFESTIQHPSHCVNKYSKLFICRNTMMPYILSYFTSY